MNHEGTRLRFDDKLATVLAQPRDDAAARAAAWRQIVDILAQMPAGVDDPLPAYACALLRALRDEVPQQVRTEAVAALAGRRVHPSVVSLVAEEKPAVAAALIGQVRLEDGEWLFLLPRLSITARALLRHRRDLSANVRVGLASFGPSDFALPPGAPLALEADSPAEIVEQEGATIPRDDTPADIPVPDTAEDAPLPQAGTDEPVVPAAIVEASGGETQIRDLLARIAAYRRDDDPTSAVPAVEAETFRFETGPDGVILWLDGAPRAAMIGATIAQAAESFEHGVDGQAAGAFRHRAPFRDARMLVAGGSSVAGEWRIAGVPVFDPRDGRFTGYRGTARRPRLDEQAAPPPAGLYGTGLPADALRQLVHELRTPLNAIVGFGEMIERQVLGPAASPYRAQASAIVAQGKRLLGVVDDLDMAARADVERPDSQPAIIAPAALLRRLWRGYQPIAAARGVTLDMRIAEDAGSVSADPAAIERMFARLMAATIGLGQPGETIAARLSRAADRVALRLTRPALLAGSAERQLLDPGFSPEGDWPEAPLLGLGFALRLVRALAEAAGGTLEIGIECFVLHLPATGGWQASEAAPL